MSNRCSCGRNPCQCHTVCVTPPVCIPPVPSRPPLATITIEELLKLIESKCDKATCEYLKEEIDKLNELLGVDPTNPDTPDIAFQLVSNMVESLEGDLTDRYPSAELLKTQLQSLWKCMYDKHQHHGEWVDNYVVRDVNKEEDENCLIDGDPNSIPDTIKVIVPVDVGSTVFHTIDGRRCLYESLIDNNTEEPSALGVLEGKWLNYCDVQDVISCVLPRRKVEDCTETCDDPNNDGVIEEATLCERVTKVEECCKNQTGLPAGAVTFVSQVEGEFTLVHDRDSAITHKRIDNADWYWYKTLCSTKTFSKDDYAYLKTTGKDIILSNNATAAYRLIVTNSSSIGPHQWDTRITVNGNVVKDFGDMYACNVDGKYHSVADTSSSTVQTNNEDLVVDFCYGILFIEKDDGTWAVVGDEFKTDMASSTILFNAGGN